MICNKKELAKISSSPGKTQLINHFSVVSNNRQEWYLVDLPGYGFAKVSQAQRKSWQKMIEDYIRKRENLVTLFALIDSRHSPQEKDLKFMNQLGEWQVPFALIFTKADKVTQRETAAHVKEFLEKMKKDWEYLPPHFVTSAIKHLGARQLRQYIGQLNENLLNQRKQ
jgi:GTP-binding protein